MADEDGSVSAYRNTARRECEVSDGNLTPEIRSALLDFQRYLSDELAPLMALDSIEKVISLPPEVAAGQIKSWIGGQYRGRGAEIPVSDYLFHAVKKIHHFAALQLVPEKKISAYLMALRVPILEMCPPADRQFLEQNLEVVGDPTPVGGGAEIVYRQPGTERKLASKKDEQGRRAEIEQRMSLIMDRLSRIPARSDASGSVTPARHQILSEAISTAVSYAHSGGELDENLDEIRRAGADVDPSRLFRYLGNTLPEWAVPVRESMSADSEDFPSSESDPIEAMKRLLTLSDSPQEKSRRFRQLIEAAIEQFNEGALGRAVTMLGLAEGLVEAREITEEDSERVRRSVEVNLDANRLRESAETPEAHYLLRKLLRFFPGLTPKGILSELQKQERRDRRRLLLALVEVFEEDAREAALEIFAEQGDERLAKSDPYFARNLLYVLNRIPQGEKSSDHQMRLAENLSSPSYPPFLTKEAIATLGQTRNPRAAEVLARRLQEYEALLTGGGKLPYPPGEVRQIVDRTVAALVKIGSDQALSAVVEHGLSTDPALGDSLRRLSALGNRNLFDRPEIVGRLVGAVQSRLPKKVLGIVMQRKSGDDIEKLIDALSGTDAPEVLELLDSIRQKHPDTTFGQKAQAILESSGVGKSAMTAAAPKLSGDLELFGLPNLVQNLASMEVSGVLTIMDSEGKRTGAVAYDGGKITRCHTGELRGKDAFFQLFEHAGPGSFSFVEIADAAKGESETEPMNVTPLIMEALRRFDELRLSKAIVPPDSSLGATSVKPVHDPREKDPKVIREVWLKAASGEPPEKWEPEIPVDSYRVWRLLRHWVESGALELR